MVLTREQLLQKINDICIDPIDAISLDAWNSLSLDELRTVVALLTDGDFMAMINPGRRGRNRRGHCFMIEGLVQHLQRNPNMTNPMTGRPITRRQRQLINSAYRRITGRESPLSAAARPAAVRPAAGGTRTGNVIIHTVRREEVTADGVSSISINGSSRRGRDVVITITRADHPTRVTEIDIQYNSLLTLLRQS